jgi:hypothetical protein
MDITATLDEESCSDFATSDEVTTADLKTTDPGGDLCATNTTITEQQKTNVDSDFSLIFCQGHTGPTNNWVILTQFQKTPAFSLKQMKHITSRRQISNYKMIHISHPLQCHTITD